MTGRLGVAQATVNKTLVTLGALLAPIMIISFGLGRTQALEKPISKVITESAAVIMGSSAATGTAIKSRKFSLYFMWQSNHVPTGMKLEARSGTRNANLAKHAQKLLVEFCALVRSLDSFTRQPLTGLEDLDLEDEGVRDDCLSILDSAQVAFIEVRQHVRDVLPISELVSRSMGFSICCSNTV